MKEKTIRRLIKLVEESNIDQLEVTSWGRKVKITRRLYNNNGHSDQGALVQTISASPAPVQPAPAPSRPAAETAVETAPPDAEKKYMEVKAPMVGTFYAAPAPDTPPYVTLNQKIEVGQVVCIVEAMKLMNEIESEVAGRVAKIMVENTQPVEFGQAIFLIDPAG